MTPSARKQHSMNRIQEKAWLFGGETETGISNELWYYDMHQRHWFLVSLLYPPSPRHGHATVTQGSKIYLHAGCNSIEHECYSDLYVLDTVAEDWNMTNQGNNIVTREAHATSFIGGILYFFGGRYLMEKCYNDFWQLETDEPCPDDCSGNGNCTTIGCNCSSGFTGSSCAIVSVCRLNCNYHGSCEENECICYPGFYGSYCQGLVQCPNNCTSGLQGTCLDSGQCSCFIGYTGDDCSLKED